MFNAIANSLLIATRNDKGLPTHQTELLRHEERKREELHRQQLNKRFHRQEWQA